MIDQTRSRLRILAAGALVLTAATAAALWRRRLRRLRLTKSIRSRTKPLGLGDILIGCSGLPGILRCATTSLRCSPRRAVPRPRRHHLRCTTDAPTHRLFFIRTFSTAPRPRSALSLSLFPFTRGTRRGTTYDALPMRRPIVCF
jgi:hypothetical protein